LRALGAGQPIAIEVTEDPSIGVDTAEDAKKFEAYLA
jgi:3-deoxy-manno-octulosonate cytidylyltransferase (CMP-KDO synthetase)